ncbi:hypothetical protein T265_00314 [Opisthorchis viverrini]|uniref:EF-hand domain-containing protein n=1 Tax=Opisthorchis viverrini TaxID=6198 RepID=A0A075A2B7_OPIVI|nr:hypothetical protein T265_00314 [Opisthorchis viverrini]KER33868.1 hypothetical protein T265_00314 [Opisthorchis viverrini]
MAGLVTTVQPSRFDSNIGSLSGPGDRFLLITPTTPPDASSDTSGVREVLPIDLQRAFTMYELNEKDLQVGDEKILVKDIGEVVRALGLNPTESDIRKFNNRNDPGERITFEMFVPIYQALAKEQKDINPEEFIEGFRVFDKESNGFISAAELRHLLTALGERLREDEVDQLLAGMENSQGLVPYEGERISFEMFIPIYQTLAKEEQKTDREVFIEAFRIYDKDSNGMISAAELRHLMCGLGERLTDYECDQLVSGLEDSKGFVSYEGPTNPYIPEEQGPEIDHIESKLVPPPLHHRQRY